VQSLKAEETIRSLLVVVEAGLIVGCTDGLVEFWHLSQWSVISSQSYSADVLRSSRTYDCRVKKSSSTAHTYTISALAKRATGTIVPGSRDSTLKIWSTAGGNCTRTLVGHTDIVTSVVTQNQSLISASYDQTCKSWDAESGACLQTFVGHAAKIRSIAPEGMTLVSGDVDGEVRVWSLRKGSCRAMLHSHTSVVNYITINSELIVTAGADGKIGAWLLNSVQEKWVIPKAHPHAVNSIQVKDGMIVSGGSDEAIKIWRLLDGTLLREIGYHPESVWAVGFTSDGLNSVVEAFWDDGATLTFLGPP
jgi:WD40 repeat protein